MSLGKLETLKTHPFIKIIQFLGVPEKSEAIRLIIESADTSDEMLKHALAALAKAYANERVGANTRVQTALAAGFLVGMYPENALIKEWLAGFFELDRTKELIKEEHAQV